MSSLNLSRKALIGYGVLALPLSFAGIPLYLYVPDFYITQHGVSMLSMGISLLSIRAFDALQDPFIGYLSDRFPAGRMKVIAASMLLMGLAFFMLYSPPNGFSTVTWFCISMGLATLGFSIVTINFNALGSLWSKDSEQKTRITATRETFGILGLFVAILTPSVLGSLLPPQEAFRIYGAIFLAIVLGSGFLFYIWWQSTQLATQIEKTVNASGPVFSACLKKIAQARLLTFFFIYALSVLSSSIPAVLVIYYVRDRLQAASLTGLFLGLYFISAIIGIPFWKHLSKRLNKLNTWSIAMLMAGCSLIWAFWVQPHDIYVYGLICVGSGFALGAELILPPSILSDIIDREGLQPETAFVFSVLNFLAKLALAFATGLSLMTLGMQGYASGAIQNPHVLNSLNILYALVPSILKIIAASVLYMAFKKSMTDERNGKQVKEDGIAEVGGFRDMREDACSGNKNVFNMRDFFDGTIRGWGIIQNFEGKLLHSFEVTMNGAWHGDTGTLTEHFLFNDGETKERVWTIKKLRDDYYVAYASDLVEEAVGRAWGSSMQWTYRMDLKMGRATYRITFDDWMFRMDDNVVMNRSYLKKFGITVAQLTLFMRK